MSSDQQQPNSGFMTSIEKLRGELDRVVEFAREKGGQAFSAFRSATSRGWTPDAEIIEGMEDVTVRLDLPGVLPKTISISLAGNMLTVSGEKTLPVPAQSDTVHLRERPAGGFNTSLPMPVPVDPEKVSAESRHGVLTIRLSKTESAKPRQIHVDIETHE